MFYPFLNTSILIKIGPGFTQVFTLNFTSTPSASLWQWTAETPSPTPCARALQQHCWHDILVIKQEVSLPLQHFSHQEKSMCCRFWSRVKVTSFTQHIFWGSRYMKTDRRKPQPLSLSQVGWNQGGKSRLTGMSTWNTVLFLPLPAQLPLIEGSSSSSIHREETLGSVSLFR